MKVELIDFRVIGDERGSLVALEGNRNIPFEIKRVYYIFGTKQGDRRGFHAHKKLIQVAVCINGSCKMLLDNGKDNQIVILEKPQKGLVIREMIWHEMYDFSEDCVLMVLASDYYDETDYIRNFVEFRRKI